MTRDERDALVRLGARIEDTLAHLPNEPIQWPGDRGAREELHSAYETLVMSLQMALRKVSFITRETSGKTNP